VKAHFHETNRFNGNHRVNLIQRFRAAARFSQPLHDSKPIA
jgi:hypothetical protein